MRINKIRESESDKKYVFDPELITFKCRLFAHKDRKKLIQHIQRLKALSKQQKDLMSPKCEAESEEILDDFSPGLFKKASLLDDQLPALQ
jgi:hypothetical protein